MVGNRLAIASTRLRLEAGYPLTSPRIDEVTVANRTLNGLFHIGNALSAGCQSVHSRVSPRDSVGRSPSSGGDLWHRGREANVE